MEEAGAECGSQVWGNPQDCPRLCKPLCAHPWSRGGGWGGRKRKDRGSFAPPSLQRYQPHCPLCSFTIPKERRPLPTCAISFWEHQPCQADVGVSWATPAVGLEIAHTTTSTNAHPHPLEIPKDSKAHLLFCDLSGENSAKGPSRTQGPISQTLSEIPAFKEKPALRPPPAAPSPVLPVRVRLALPQIPPSPTIANREDICLPLVPVTPLPREGGTRNRLVGLILPSCFSGRPNSASTSD